ncbi:peptide deformylase [Candidatus Peribacteria bacterium RIFOXYC2_FULL_55_14]|nr:MAG: Peptide deformylase [Candidatus Peribacteria bacterium GW2011_GWC2_54_8]KKW38765.1 MAG: Peptide deformylase [Candidatus Peribacteria bacterium GW2011_GWB1_54_5]OGJ70927.1 MAG: peptide deformylase [Candidatus Peribacteria bacterium RIFOXYA1_FULL_56_14]OGJ74222.1 MAG: peptide deformylase [Candidatus Peribacteria bacterium RIFOXYB1_FULL_54_35]OGJ75244.1 MAG: peptide deformylase [Candidatus Peribacteria bacterium RIFOXYA2_FULL_55_28]OGJ75839.1 MAG: peptide deformylase [Candidatus Peribacte
MAVLPIVTGEKNPVLRRKAAKIPKISRETTKLIKDMQQTLQDAEGVGLAAPQVGKSLRLCIVMINGKHTPLINPEITWRSKEMDTMEEGCLSLPGVWLPIARPASVTFTYLDEKGKQQERKVQGFESHVVQHEIDHLDGVLIVDYPQVQIKTPVHTAESVL